MASTHRAICDGVADAIVALELADYPNENVIGADRVLVRWGIDVEPNALPAIFISPVGTVATVGGTNERDDWSYPVTVYIVDRQSFADPDPLLMDAVLDWRERISRRFINQRLTGVADVNLPTQFNASPVLDERLVPAYQLLIEPVYFAFICRQKRG